MTSRVIDKTGWNYTIVDNDIVMSEQLDIYEKMLYIVLKKYANMETKEAFPGVKTLAKYSGMSSRKAQLVLRSLESKGFIEVELRTNKTSIYTLLPPSHWGESHSMGEQDSPQGRMTCTTRANDMRHEGEQHAPELKKHELKKHELKKENKNGDLVNSPSATDGLFDEWWNLYAHKVGDKKKCRTRYKTLLKKFSHETIMNGTKAYKDHLNELKRRGQFAPNLKYPYTFLNGENFNDDYSIAEGVVNHESNRGRNERVAGKSYEDVLAEAERDKRAWGG